MRYSGYKGFHFFAKWTGYLREALDFGATNQICILVHLPQESNIQATKKEVTPTELTEIVSLCRVINLQRPTVYSIAEGRRARFSLTAVAHPEDFCHA